MQRQIQSESLAQQTHALVTQETAQIRGGLKSDLVAIEAQLNEQRSRDAALQGMEETFNLRLREIHSQLAQGTVGARPARRRVARSQESSTAPGATGRSNRSGGVVCVP